MNTSTNLLETVKDQIQHASGIYSQNMFKEKCTIQLILTWNFSDVICYITASENQLVLTRGFHDNPDVTLKTSYENWLLLINLKLNPRWGIFTGKLKFSGNVSLFIKLLLTKNKPVRYSEIVRNTMELNPT